MADRWAVQNGNWSSTSTWNGGTLPTAADDVYADGFTVTINQNVTVLSVRTTQRSGGSAGGSFTLNAGFTLTANAVAGTSVCVTFSSASPNSAAIIGNCTGGSTSNAHGAQNSSSGTLTVTGNCTGGSGDSADGVRNSSSGTTSITGNCNGGTFINSIGARNASTGTLTITGNCTGGSGFNCMGARNDSGGTLTITGNCTGGSAGNTWGAQNASTGTLTITGNCTGGSVNGGNASGASNNSTGMTTINGSAIGSNFQVGAANFSTGILSVKRAIGNDWGIGNVGANSTAGVQSVVSGSQTRVEELEFGLLGQSPIAGAVSVPDLTTNVCLVHRLSKGKKTLIDPATRGVPLIGPGGLVY